MDDIQKAYLILAIIWLIIIIVFKLYEIGIIGWIILLIPFLVFAIGAHNSSTPVEGESYNFNENGLTIGILILLPILVYCDKTNSINRTKFISLIILAIIIFLLTFVVIWVPVRFLNLINRINTALITISVVLVVYALYMYYENRMLHEINIEHEIYKYYDDISLSG